MDSLAEMEAFVRVVHAGSFSAAARASGLTPSAVSKQISRLEARLGARLFNRTTRRLGLTEVGAAFHERAQRILSEVEEAERAVSHASAAPRGTLRLNVPVVFGRLHVAPLLPEFLGLYPEVRIDITFNDRFVDLLEEGVDVAIRIGDLGDSSLIARRLAPNRRVVCGAPAYFERNGYPEHPADLSRHNCLVYTYLASRNDWRFVCANKPRSEAQDVVQVSGNFEANNAEAIHGALRSGLGLGLLPLWLVGEDLRAGRLVQALPGYHAVDSAVYAVYPPGRHLSPKVRCFIDFLAARLRIGSGGDERAGSA